MDGNRIKIVTRHACTIQCVYYHELDVFLHTLLMLPMYHNFVCNNFSLEILRLHCLVCRFRFRFTDPGNGLSDQQEHQQGGVSQPRWAENEGCQR